MDPKIWGPKTWFYLHSLPDNVTPAQKIGDCINNLVLPCTSCQESFDVFRRQHSPLNIRTKDDAHRYINSLHNSVNRRLGKPFVSLDECKRRWCKTGAVASAGVGSAIVSAAFGSS